MKDILNEDRVRQQVRETYGAVARNNSRGCGCGTGGCGTGGCGTGGCGGGLQEGTAPEVLGYAGGDTASVPEGAEMGLGCGNPTALTSIRPGETILDLGSGGGFDCFLAAHRTGPAGKVIGVDMTPDMISKARSNAVKGGYTHVEFRLGEIENLPVADNSADLVISNCVINLSPDKPRVYAETFRVLKPGGRIAVSDIVALQPLPQELAADIAAYTGCVAGASSPAGLEAMLSAAGFEKIQVGIKEAGREFINDWLPGKRAGDYVAPADITAIKPGGTCCGDTCCK